MIGFQRRFDPTFSALKQRLDAGEIGNPEMLIITSRDPGPPPVSYIKVSGGIFKDMLIHDFDVFRWVLEDEAQSVYATGSCLVDAAIGEAGDVDSTAVTIRTRGGRLCQINTSRRAAYGYDQRFEVLGSKGLLQARNHTPTQVVAQTAAGVMRGQARTFLPRTLPQCLRQRDEPFLRRFGSGQARAHYPRGRREGAGTGRSRHAVVAGRARSSR